ncbi:MAG TPA: energy transducer TonB [Gammaproteobacteria bacterium]|nr:energy transducer TonB [Gammaproteobacteria bacterium]
MKFVLGVIPPLALLGGCSLFQPASAPVAAPATIMIATPAGQPDRAALQSQVQEQKNRQILLRFTVQPDGSVVNLQVRFSELSDTDTQTVLTTVQQWHFKPAREQGQTVARDFIYPLFFGPDADSQRTVFFCRNQASVYRPGRHCEIVVSGGWRIYRFDPAYPAALLRQGLAGEVTLGFDIGPDGRAEHPDVVKSNPPAVFDAAAIAAVSQWYFEPLDGARDAASRPRQHVTVSVRFTPPPIPSGA